MSIYRVSLLEHWATGKEERQTFLFDSQSSRLLRYQRDENLAIEHDTVLTLPSIKRIVEDPTDQQRNRCGYFIVRAYVTELGKKAEHEFDLIYFRLKARQISLPLRR